MRLFRYKLSIYLHMFLQTSAIVEKRFDLMYYSSLVEFATKKSGQLSSKLMHVEAVDCDLAFYKIERARGCMVHLF